MATGVANRSEHATLGRVLREAREELGLTQRALARKVGRAETYIYKIEAGRQALDVVGLLDIAEALRIPIGELATRFATECAKERT